jgi:hypothetical protein
MPMTDSSNETIEDKITRFQGYLKFYINEMYFCIKNWELFEETQDKKEELRKVIPDRTAIHALNTIQYSLIQSTQMSLMKLWDKKSKYKNNVRFGLIYDLIRSPEYCNFIKTKYAEYDDMINRDKRMRREFRTLYNKKSSGEHKKVFDELKDLRDKRLAHTEMIEIEAQKHSIEAIRAFYQDSIRMIEVASSFLNCGINFENARQSSRRDARHFVAVLTKSKN